MYTCSWPEWSAGEQAGLNIRRLRRAHKKNKCFLRYKARFTCPPCPGTPGCDSVSSTENTWRQRFAAFARLRALMRDLTSRMGGFAGTAKSLIKLLTVRHSTSMSPWKDLNNHFCVLLSIQQDIFCLGGNMLRIVAMFKKMIIVFGASFGKLQG